jgi:methyl-accepting chemotaxis protein
MIQKRPISYGRACSLIKSVNNDAVAALNVANDTTREALKGDELMQNTIAGMNSIRRKLS